MRVYLVVLLLSSLLQAPVASAQTGPPEIAPKVQDQERVPRLERIRRSFNPFVFSEGYVLGAVSRESVEGLIWEVFEGQILLGLSSVPGGVVEEECVNNKLNELLGQARAGKPSSETSIPQIREQAIDDCMVRINPFPISSYSTDWQERLNEFRSTVDMSLIRYKGFWLHPLLQSPNFIKEVIPVKNYSLPFRSLDESNRFPVYQTIHYGTSQVEGRTVIASMEGIVRKHYHAIVQAGVGGGKFVHIEVPTSSLFDYIVKCMATGKLVRIHYYILYDPQAYPSNLLLGYGTGLRAYRVDVID